MGSQSPCGHAPLPRRIPRRCCHLLGMTVRRNRAEGIRRNALFSRLRHGRQATLGRCARLARPSHRGSGEVGSGQAGRRRAATQTPPAVHNAGGVRRSPRVRTPATSLLSPGFAACQQPGRHLRRRDCPRGAWSAQQTRTRGGQSPSRVLGARRGIPASGRREPPRLPSLHPEPGARRNHRAAILSRSCLPGRSAGGPGGLRNPLRWSCRQPPAR